MIADPHLYWSGQWVADHFDVRLQQRSGALQVDAGALAGLALRNNPRRAHLVVSTVLGKHVPTDPDVVYAAARLLGALVAARLDATELDGTEVDGTELDSFAPCGRLLTAALAGSTSAARELIAHCEKLPPVRGSAPLVLGYAETATALGHAVADSVGAYYLHSTRRQVPGVTSCVEFEEAHSHATAHALLAERPAEVLAAEQVVLVDDELTTGRTALNTVAALEHLRPGRSYLIAALLDLRSDADLSAFAEFRMRTGIPIHVVSLARGTVVVPADILHRAATVLGGQPKEQQPSDRRRATLRSVPVVGWPTDLPEGGRHGFEPAARQSLTTATADVAAAVAAGMHSDRILVLGSEELMYAPLQIARSLSRLAGPGATVLFSSTTRSPVHAVDEPGYAIRHALTFPSHDRSEHSPGPRYAYNIGPVDFDDVVLIIDAAAYTARLEQQDGLLDKLRRCCARVHVVVLPCYQPTMGSSPPPTIQSAAPLPAPLSGPEFGSYPPADVKWLLSDLSAVVLEAETEEREEAIAQGTAHYAESLPIEYQPSAQYQDLFGAALAESAATVAAAIGIVTEILLAERGRDLVLASLARAGVPVAILMRRWAAFAHGLQLPHYALSIVRGRGIDSLALRYLAENYRSGSIAFVDGWTGKGAITAELQSAVRTANADNGWAFDPELAVLADTGRCTSTFGTRADFLIPSACLNSTVSGLVSRTVLNDALIGADMFHGAKFYSELASADVSMQFIDAVTGEFAAVASAVARDWPLIAQGDRTPDWTGWHAVEKISADYGIGDVNLVKPGVGETTRVLLRRVPWKVLMRRDAAASLPHIRLLAQQREVEIELLDELAYQCVGLIHPRFSRATSVGSAAATPWQARSNGPR